MGLGRGALLWLLGAVQIASASLPSFFCLRTKGFTYGVRRQSFWDKERLKLRESLARLVCNVMRLADDAAGGG